MAVIYSGFLWKDLAWRFSFKDVRNPEPSVLRLGAFPVGEPVPNGGFTFESVQRSEADVIFRPEGQREFTFQYRRVK